MNTPKNQARGQNSHALHMNWYEFPDTDALESWTYTSEFTYQAGQRVDFHTSSTFDGYSIKIVRDGARPETVYCAEGLRGECFTTPIDASVKGCGWPLTHSWETPVDLKSGGY